jgi:murein DD-endopeptidase MepM/ murein hydrolase activator NlpD
MKFLFQPVKPLHVNQMFGWNKACISTDGQRTFITCDGLNPPQGFRSLYSTMKGHNGMDLAAKRWQPVYCAQSGIVSEVVTEEARGLGVGVITTDEFYCNELARTCQWHIRYWHHIANNVHIGDKVVVGDLLAYADSTGQSTGDHLHFEIKPVLVTNWDEKGTPKRWTNLLQDNGYFGAVDPWPYMYPYAFALDAAGVFKKAREVIALINDWIGDKMRYGLR